ncbi:hypothetical protein ACOJUR_09885 [Alicyclobacillus tolerans]|uniref:hypothetical protein n=1 Tax=Alicyclobacillus tolerans TaxID=90970 RepID=UPI003B7664B5
MIVAIGQNENNNPIPIKMVFVRDRDCSRQWLKLLSAVVNLSDDEMIRIYFKRWDIECFFKISNPICDWQRNCRGAHTTKCLPTPHIFHEVHHTENSTRDEQDPRTIGALFFDCLDKLNNIRFPDAMCLLLEWPKSITNTADIQNDNVIDRTVEQFINHLSRSIKENLVA